MTVKAVEAPEPLAIDDEFAKSLGLESLDELKQTIRERIAIDYARASREKVKRKLLDELDSAIVRRSRRAGGSGIQPDLEAGRSEQKATGRSFAEENTTEEAARADYRKIAERRVRLGLLLAEVGTKAEVKVSDEEMTQALLARARSFPGPEKEIWDFYRNNSQAFAELRAPIYEEKVVDHILGLAKVEDRKVTQGRAPQAGRRRAGRSDDGRTERRGAGAPRHADRTAASFGTRLGRLCWVRGR